MAAAGDRVGTAPSAASTGGGRVRMKHGGCSCCPGVGEGAGVGRAWLKGLDLLG